MSEENKSWDKTWDYIYESQEWGKYPEIELVRFISRNFNQPYENRAKVKILDLGCGTGSSTFFLSNEGFKPDSVDGSQVAVDKLKEIAKQKNIEVKAIQGDFLDLPYEQETFDAIIDIACIQHNSLDNIKNILSECYKLLKPGGKLFSTLLQTDDRVIPEKYGEITLTKAREDVKDLFKAFSDISIDHKTFTDNNNKDFHTSWVVIAKK